MTSPRPSRTMREIDLREYKRSEPISLSAEERDVLREAGSVAVEPAEGSDEAYHLTPGSTIGAMEVGGLSVVIRPKLKIGRVLYLASYAMGAFKLQEKGFEYPEADTLIEILALALGSAARRAFARGVLHGYRTEEEALHTVRGRIMVAEQIRRRFGVGVPIEVRYDDFTDDILENRLVKAAGALLGRMRIRSASSREGLGWIAATLGDVSAVRYSPKEIPEVEFGRLNGHYREVVGLSRLILRHWTYEAKRGGVRARGFMIDMNRVFQEFVTLALREELGVSERRFCSDKEIPHPIYLAAGRKVRLEPDLSWWEGAACMFVGDAKYKRIDGGKVPNADLYQLLAYATALDLPGGLLVYAKEEMEPTEMKPIRYRVVHADKTLEVAALDLSGSIEDLRVRVRELAGHVRRLQEQGRQAQAA